MNPTLDTVRQLSKQYGVTDVEAFADQLQKSGWSTATGLVNYDLEPLARLMLANPTPLRDSLPRVPGTKGDTAHRYKAILSLPSDTGRSPYVSEGQRNIAISPVITNFAAPYTVLQEESYLTFEGDEAATDFDNAQAKMRLVLLQDLFRAEEKQWLYGNYNQPLGQPVAPTLVPSTVAGGALSGTMSVIVVPLTPEGLANSNVSSAGLVQQISRSNLDSSTTIVNGGVGQPSTNTTQAMSANNTLTCTTTPIAGAAGYAWYLGTAGAEKIAAITTLATVVLNALPTSTNQLASTLTAADFSYNDGQQQGTNITAMNGLLYFAAGYATNNAYYNALTGGATITSDGEGGINEITAMLKDRWDNYRMSPTDLWMSSDVALKFRNLVAANGIVGSGNQPLIRIVQEPGKPIEIVSGSKLPSIHNFFTGDDIQVHVHPYMPKGMILASARTLPFIIDEMPSPIQVRVTRDYWQIEWPLRTTRWETAVRVREVLENRFPPALGLIQNIN